MNRDKNFERRMIVSKYSNRPPFDLKKPKASYDIEDKMKAYPDEACKSCCKNRSGKFKEPPRPSKSLPINQDSEVEAATTRSPTVKKVIPKILKHFQKLTQSTENTTTTTNKATMSRNISVQTLYRNPNPCRLGKNIPKHKLMKSLLQNLDSEAEHAKKNLPDFVLGKHYSTGKIKHKHGKKLFFDKDEVIRPDFSISLDKRKEPLIKEPKVERARPSLSYRKPQKPQKVDKGTSTTGLMSKDMLQHPYRNIPSDPRNASISYHCNKIGPTKSRTIKEERKKDITSEFSSESYLVEAPTKDVSHQSHELETISMHNPINFRTTRRNESDDRFRQKPLESTKITLKPSNPRTTPMNVKPERRPSDFQARNSLNKLKAIRDNKTFVQTQVEKLDKMMRHTKIPCPKDQSQPQNGIRSIKNKDLGRGQGDAPPNPINRRAAATDYIVLMDKIRANYPQFDHLDNNNCQTFDSDHAWSDTYYDGSEIVPEQITFPKETKTAIDQRLSEKRQRLPLSKFTNVHDCRPAIQPTMEFARETQYIEGNSHINQQVNYKMPLIQGRPKSTKRDLQKPGPAPVQNKSKIHLPCKKNLLCDRGEQHSGPCGYYSHNQNKVVY